jgi:hypothetical protein
MNFLVGVTPQPPMYTYNIYIYIYIYTSVYPCIPCTRMFVSVVMWERNVGEKCGRAKPVFLYLQVFFCLGGGGVGSERHAGKSYESNGPSFKLVGHRKRLETDNRNYVSSSFKLILLVP